MSQQSNIKSQQSVSDNSAQIYILEQCEKINNQRQSPKNSILKQSHNNYSKNSSVKFVSFIDENTLSTNKEINQCSPIKLSHNQNNNSENEYQQGILQLMQQVGIQKPVDNQVGEKIDYNKEYLLSNIKTQPKSHKYTINDKQISDQERKKAIANDKIKAFQAKDKKILQKKLNTKIVTTKPSNPQNKNEQKQEQQSQKDENYVHHKLKQLNEQYDIKMKNDYIFQKYNVQILNDIQQKKQLQTNMQEEVIIAKNEQSSEKCQQNQIKKQINDKEDEIHFEQCKKQIIALQQQVGQLELQNQQYKNEQTSQKQQIITLTKSNTELQLKLTYLTQENKDYKKFINSNNTTNKKNIDLNNLQVKQLINENKQLKSQNQQLQEQNEQQTNNLNIYKKKQIELQQQIKLLENSHSNTVLQKQKDTIQNLFNQEIEK